MRNTGAAYKYWTKQVKVSLFALTLLAVFCLSFFYASATGKAEASSVQHEVPEIQDADNDPLDSPVRDGTNRKDFIFRADRFEWEHGKLLALSNGLEETGNYSYSVTDFLELPVLANSSIRYAARSAKDTIASVCFYSESKQYISGLRSDRLSGASEGTIPEGARFIRLCAHDHGVDYAFYEVEADRIATIEKNVTALGLKLDELNASLERSLSGEAQELVYTLHVDRFEWEHGKLLSIRSGRVESGRYAHNVTDFIELPELADSSIRYVARSVKNTIASVCFYNESKQYISGLRSNNVSTPTKGKIPEGTRYIRMCSNDNGVDYAFFEVHAKRPAANGNEADMEVAAALPEQEASALMAIRNRGNLLPDMDTGIVDGVTFARADYGHYILNGTNSGSVLFPLITSKSEMPFGFVPGKTYRLKFFTTTLNVFPFIQSFDAAGSATKLNKYASVGCDFTIPESAVGLIVCLQTVGDASTFVNEHVEIAIYDPESDAGMDSKEYVWEPRPMLSICDDDGYTVFYEDILPLIRETGVPIATANTTLRTEMREATDALYAARADHAQGRVTDEELAEVQARLDAVRAEACSEEQPEDYALRFMNWAQIQECYANGAEVLSHTYGHFLNAEDMQMSDEIVRGMYIKAKHSLDLHGIPCDCVVYNGQANGYLKTRSSASYAFKYGIRASGDRLNYVGGDPMQILRYGIGGTSWPYEAETIIELVSQLESVRSGWMILNIHTSSSEWTKDTVQVLREVLEYCQAHNIPIVTFAAATHWYYELGYQPGAIKYEEAQIR